MWLQCGCKSQPSQKSEGASFKLCHSVSGSATINAILSTSRPKTGPGEEQREWQRPAASNISSSQMAEDTSPQRASDFSRTVQGTQRGHEFVDVRFLDAGKAFRRVACKHLPSGGELP